MILSENRNVISKAAEIVPKIYRPYNRNIGGIRTVSKSFEKCLSNIPGKYEIKELHKNHHTGHCRHIAGSTNVKIQNVCHGQQHDLYHRL
jgi:hypothetical protein